MIGLFYVADSLHAASKSAADKHNRQPPASTIQ